MKKTLFALAAVLAIGTAAAHNQTLNSNATASVAGSNLNLANTSSSGNGLSVSGATQLTAGSATSGSTVATAPGFNNGSGTGTTSGTLFGATSTNTAGTAFNVSVGGGNGNAGATGGVTANAASGYNSLNNYVPLAVKQDGSATSSAGQLSEVGRNGAAGSAAGSNNDYAGAGFATRTNPIGNVYIVGGQVADTKNSNSWSTQAGIGNVVGLTNGTVANTVVSGCFKAAKTGTVGGC